MAKTSAEMPNERDGVFLVEPDAEGRERFEQMLRESGFTVTASDGSLPLPENERDEPGVILVSAGRPGFDELEFIRRVRTHPVTGSTPVVVLAEKSQDDLAIAALKEGADDVAAPPFSRERLVDRVKAHICLAHLRKEEDEHVPRAFEQLRLSERRYRSLVSAIAAFVWTSEEDGRVTETLSAWERFTGQSWNDYRDFGWLSAIHPDDRNGMRDLWRKGPDKKRRPVEAEFRLKSSDGSYRNIHLKAIPVRNRKANLQEWVGTATDITERRRAEEALRSSEERLRLILESSTDFAIFTTDMEGKVTTWNAGAERLLGYSDDEIRGTDFHRIFSKEDVEAGAPHDEMESALKTGRGVDRRWHRRKDGSFFWADGLLMPLRDKDGKPCGYLKIIRDFSEQKKSEDDLRALTEELEQRVTERTRELEESRTRLRSLVFRLNKAEQLERQRIAAELHDSPAQLLTAARFSLEAAMREAGDSPVAHSLKNVGNIVSEATRATRHLMTELSGPRVLEHDDLVGTIEWVVEKMREKGFAVEFSYNEPHISLEPDLLTLLFQIVRELLLNARKHAGVSAASVNLHKSRGKVEIEVVDEGRGFDPKEKIETRGGEGGFGLFNAQERLNWLGGKLDIDSAPGRGTRIKLALPLGEPAAGPEEEPAASKPAKRKQRGFERRSGRYLTEK